MAYIDGDDFIDGAILSFQQANRMKDNFRLATPPANIQPGMLFSDSDDDKLYHEGAAASEEILQATRSDDVNPLFAGVLLSGPSQWKKGADVASAAILPLGDDGNYFDITGAAGITSISQQDADGNNVQAGTVAKLHFDGACLITHDATGLPLPGGANITTAAGDELEFICFDSVNEYWRGIAYSPAGTLDVPRGGLGVGTLADGALIAGAGVAAVEALAVGLVTEVLVGGGAGVNPGWSTDLPAALTIGGAYIYRVGGTDVAFEDGGTGQSAYTDGQLLIGGTTLSDIQKATLTPGAGILITNGDNSITLAATGEDTVETKTDNYPITTDDFGKTLVMNAADKTFSLPSVSAANVGALVKVAFINTGKLTIDAADADTIDDSGAGEGIYCEQNGEKYSSIALRLISATEWIIVAAKGIWTTTE